MTKSSTVPAAPKTLALDDLLDDFEPRAAIRAAALSVSTPSAAPATQARPRQTETSFPSREPKGPKHIQVNCYLKAGVAERFKAFLKRDEYTTWSYGDAIEFLLDQYERGGKKPKS